MINPSYYTRGEALTPECSILAAAQSSTLNVLSRYYPYLKHQFCHFLLKRGVDVILWARAEKATNQATVRAVPNTVFFALRRFFKIV